MHGKTEQVTKREAITTCMLLAMPSEAAAEVSESAYINSLHFAFRLQHFQIHRFSGRVISTFHAGRCHVNNEDIQPLEKANNIHLLYLLPPHLSRHAAMKTFPFKPLNSPFNEARATWVGSNPGGDLMKVMENAVF